MKWTVTVLVAVAFRGTHCSPVESGDQPLHWRWAWDDSMGPDMLPVGRPLSLAHRGASGMFPEHTRMAYEEAVRSDSILI
jgi:glycerophosphoryl diester phosphodiesterase